MAMGVPLSRVHEASPFDSTSEILSITGVGLDQIAACVKRSDFVGLSVVLVSSSAVDVGSRGRVITNLAGL